MQEIANTNAGAMKEDETERSQVASSARKETPRAQRYEIGTVIYYRVRGERRWYEGMTENISISGVLIRTDHALDLNTAIEMRFFLPVELYGECAAEVLCRGVVVRSSKCTAPTGATAIASTIVYSRFLRQMGRHELGIS